MGDIFETRLVNYTKTINEIYFHTLGSKFDAKFYTKEVWFDDDVNNKGYSELLIIHLYNGNYNKHIRILNKLCDYLNIENKFDFYNNYDEYSDCYVLMIKYDDEQPIIKYDSKEIFIQEITNILNRLLGE